MTAASPLRLLSGARATEAALFEDLSHLLLTGSEALTAEVLGAPVRVVVPSTSLRDHLARRFVRLHGPAAGLRFQTLQGLAREVLRAAGEEPPRGEALFPVLVERFCREERVLADGLDSLVDGYVPVAATVKDLLDAGLEYSLTEGVVELLAEGTGSVGAPARQRAAALVRVAGKVERAMALMEIGRAGDALRAAGRLLEDHPQLLPARAVLVHGFADATGRAADLLDALLQRPEARIYLDLPPKVETEDGVEAAFAERLVGRLGGAPPFSPEGAEAGDDGGDGSAEPWTLLVAPDPEAEVAAVAHRLRRELAAGTAPEDLAVVARDLGTYEHEIVRTFGRLGIPCHLAGGEGSLKASGRAARAVLDLLRLGPEAPVDTWLEVLRWPGEEPGPQAAKRMELRLGLHSQGIGRLADVEELDLGALDPRGLPLPLPRDPTAGSPGEAEAPEPEEPEPEEPEPEEPEARSSGPVGEGAGSRSASAPGPSRGRRRWLGMAVLQNAQRAASALLARFEAWPAAAPLGDHLEAVAAFLREDLGWGGEAAASSEAFLDEVGRLATALPGSLEVSRRELHRLLAGPVEELGRQALRSDGGGVQVLSVTEARGRTFEALFLLGLNRGEFPRPVQEDPLLSDSLRSRLAQLLPDVPIKGRGFEEERYLFAQLLSAAPRVVLSRHEASHDGRPTPPSPLLALVQAQAPERILEARAPSALGDEQEHPWPAEDHAVRAGLAGRRSSFFDALGAVAEEAREGSAFETPTAQAWSTALGALLEELDPDLRTEDGRLRRRSPGPFLGFLGPPAAGDPRQGRLFVTTLESVAACPWQTYLRRLLRLEPGPDPLEALPELTPLLLGRVVHEVLEEIVQAAEGAGAEVLKDLLGRGPGAVPWPRGAAFERILTQTTRRILAEEGIGLRVLEQPLKTQARALLEVARETLERHDGGLQTWGAEIRGSALVSVEGEREREIHFRADLAQAAAGRLHLVDVKTGRRPLSSAARDSTIRRHLLESVRRGERLQAVAYALAAAALGNPSFSNAAGEYLFVHPDLRGTTRSFLVEAGDGEAEAAFRAAVGTVLQGWDAGAFFPRLVDPEGQKEPDRCKYCEVAQACLRGDSGTRLRLLATAEALAEEAADGSLSEAERAFLDLWNLPLAAPGDGGAP